MNKVTKEGIEAKIKKIGYNQISEKFTICIITLENGFEVTGESACVDPKNYDREIGERIAKENAFEKIWLLEGYLLQEKLYLKEEFEKRNPDWKTSPDEALNRSAYGEGLREIAINKLQSKLGKKIQKNLEEDLSPVLKRIFQYPLVPEECSKVFSEGTSYENKVQQKACNCMDWTKYPQSKKLMFDQMFPDAPKGSFDYCDGKVVREEKPFDWTYWTDMMENPQFKAIAFYKMFPGVSKSLFNKLEMLSSGLIKDLENYIDQKLKKEFPKAISKAFEQTLGLEDSEEQNADYHIRLTKQYRKELDATLQSIKSSRRQSRERSLSITKIQEAIMWLGMDLKELGSANPYPTSYDPTTAKVEPTADGLKL